MPIFPPNRPASGPQYLDENEVDALEHHQRLSFSRYLSTLRNKVDDLKTKLSRPAMLDQFPGKRVPYAYSRLYGPIPQTSAGPLPSAAGVEPGGVGANSATYLTPRNGNVLVGLDGPFYWTSTAVTGYVAMADVSSGSPSAPLGDIFDMVVPNNGGATVMNSFGGQFIIRNGTNVVLPMSISFDIELYDKGRGRRLHDDRLPVELFSGASIANKNMSQPTKFAPNTNLEPRIYVNQFTINNYGEEAFIDGAAVAYVNLTFLGYKDLDV